MGEAFDLSAELAKVNSAAGAWSFLRGFFEHWSRPLLSADGCSEDEIKRAEERLGVALPQALRDGYLLCGRRDDVRRQDNLLLPDKLRVDPGGNALVYRFENQFVVEWGVQLTGQPDPPVMYRQHHAPTEWQPFLPSVSWAWVEMVLTESLFGEVLEDNRHLGPADLARVEQRFERLSVPDYPLWASGGPIRLFGGRDVILRDDARTWLWARCRTRRALSELHEGLPGGWLVSSD